MKLSSLKIDSAAVEQGQWIDGIIEMGELRLKVRGINNSDWRRLFDKLQSSVPLDQKIAGKITPEKQDEIITEVLLRTCLLDWSGIEGENGEPLPYSPEVARKLLTDPDYSKLRGAVLIAAGKVGEQASVELEADAKN